MPPDSAATKKRLLDAAYAEFSEHGLAGARVDRIAERAQANKRLIYVYFGNKDELFDLVVDQRVAAVVEAVPFTPDDLPGYAGAFFDFLVEHPDYLRLTTWRQFERPSPTAVELASYGDKVERLRATRGGDTAIAPADLLALVLSMTRAWLAASPALHAVAEPELRTTLVSHRGALVEAVRRIAAPTISA
ncbi:MAG TPA: TetR family transcriptional regulator [Gaiellales bacterium]|jgi:AcrR family transcriptional regulator